MNRNNPKLHSLLLATLLAISSMHVAMAATENALVRAAGGFESERGAAERLDDSRLQPFEVTAKPEPNAGKQVVANAESAYCCAYYIYSARTRLFDDTDNDGFYSYLRVTMDIDTDYFDAHLYLRVFLRGSDDIWNEVFRSEVFTIYGNSGLDDYEVDSELFAGFPADYYDVLVEVYEADTGALVLEHGPIETPEFSLLPMEDLVVDSYNHPPIAYSSGGGGSVSALFVWLLLSLWLWRRDSVFSDAPHTEECGGQGGR